MSIWRKKEKEKEKEKKMRGFFKKLSGRNGIVKRIFSMMLAVLMLSTTVQALPAGILKAQAAENDVNVTLHFYNGNWNWTTPAIQFWNTGGTCNTTASGYSSGPTEISGWGGTTGYVMTKEGDTNWYSITLTGDFDGFQFLDMTEKSEEEGGGHNSVQAWNDNIAQYKESTPKDLYFKETDQTWYLDSAYTQVLTAPAGTVYYNAKIHYYNTNAWSDIYLYSWSPETQGGWPGTKYVTGATGDTWCEINLENLTNPALNFKLNSGSGGETGNLAKTLNAGDNEFWIVGDTIYDSQPDSSVTQKTYKIILNYHNRFRMDDLSLYFGEGNSWSAVTDYSAYNTFPGNGANITAVDGHNGWYRFEITKKNDSVLHAIYTNGKNAGEEGALQTANLTVNVTGDTTEVWIDGDLTQEEVFTTAPASWNDSNASAVPTPASNDYVTDKFEAKIGSTMYDMDVYVNGLFEAVVSLPAGDHTVKLYKNGEDTGRTATITLTEAADVSVSYYNRSGGTYLSVMRVSGNTWTLAGILSELGRFSDWEPANTAMDMQYMGGGMYRIQLNFEALTEDKNVKYKAVKNHAWDVSVGEGGLNGSDVSVTVPAGSTSFTVWLDTNENKLYDSVRHNFTAESKQYTAMETTVSLIGYVRHIGDDNWTPATTGWEFTPISGTLYRFDYVIPNAGNDHSYKIVYNYKDWPSWGNVSLTTYKDNTHVIFLYDAENNAVYDSINHNDKVARLLGMTATPIEARVIDNQDGTLTFLTGATSGASVVLYYADKTDVETNGASAFKTMNMGTVIARKSEGSVKFGDGAIDILYYYTINGNKVLDGSSDVYTLNGQQYMRYQKAGFTGRVVTLPGSFPGASWDPSTHQMTYLGDNIYSYTFKNLASATYEYKVAIDKGWAENYGANGESGGSNIQLSVPSQQDVTIYYSDASHLTTSSLSYVFADIELQGTGVMQGTTLSDPDLTGIYSVGVKVPAGTYSDWKLLYDGQTYALNSFTLSSEKTVNVYIDVISKLRYHDAVNQPIETNKIFYNSKLTEYKSIYGAVSTAENVKFTLETGTDVTDVSLIIKGVENRAVAMSKEGSAAGGVQKWSCTTNFSMIGEYQYYFAMTNGATISVYCDDDGYYGTGTVKTLSNVKPYDLVVYKAGFETPDWMKNAVIYQIFPDRFADGDESNNGAQRTARGAVNYEYITDWYTLPENPEQEALLSQSSYEATGAHWGDGEWSNEIYGGDLKGITDNIDYLKALGVTVIYLNPVFSSISSHRYDACDYTKIDPVLGTLGDFSELVSVAEQNGMKVVLDGVFNHVSDDSIYFDRYYKYLGDEGVNTIGAYPYWAFVYDYIAEYGVSQATAESVAKNYFTTNYGVTDYSYTEWFDVFNTPMSDGNGGTVQDTMGWRAGKDVYKYDGWWGYDSMPIIKSTNGSEYQTGNWGEEIIKASDNSSVTQYWLSQGMDGWRLDVANEVSDETWQNFRESVKALNSDAVIIGEIWTDATKYILGDMYDSVMNYMFRTAVTNFAKGTNATTTMKEMEKLRERYPEEAFYAMMNLVGSHDTTRILSYLDGIDDDRNQKDIASAFPTYASTSQDAKEKQYLVAFLQFTYAGAPTVYYGDEIGMVGSDDPDDRRAFEWGKGNEALVKYYATLSKIRSQYSALRTGTVEAYETSSNNVLCYVRRDSSNEIIVLANNSTSAATVTLDLTELNITTSETQLKDAYSGDTFSISSNSVTVSVPARRGLILMASSKVQSVTLDTNSLKKAYDPAYIVAERAELTGSITGNEVIAQVPVTAPSSGTSQGSSTSSTNGSSQEATGSTGNAAGTGNTAGNGDTGEEINVTVETDAAEEVPGNVTQVTPVVNDELQKAVQKEAKKVLEDILNEEIAEDILDDDTIQNVKEAQKNGDDIITEVIAETIDESEVDEDIKDALEKQLKEYQKDNKGSDAKIVQYLDLTVLLKTNDGKELGKINKTSKELTFTIAVPEELAKEGRVFVVLRMHDGEITVLETTMNADGTISFKTDRFSTYALAYIDMPLTEEGNDGQSADIGGDDAAQDGANGFTAFIIAGIFIVVIAAVFIILLAKRKKNEKE